MMRLSPADHRHVHPMDCHCRRCIPAATTTTSHFARDTFLGLALGMGGAAVIDWIVGGPSVLSIFGMGL